MFRYLALDVETGGLDLDKSLLTAYFAVMDENMTVLDELYLRTKPDNGAYIVTAEALYINGISLINHDQTALSYKDSGQKLYSFLSKHSANGQYRLVPVGHNVVFDIDFVCDKLISKKSWRQMCSYRVRDTAIIGNFLIDSGLISPDVSGSLESYLKHFEIKEKNTLHDAKTDALACAKVYSRMLELLK